MIALAGKQRQMRLIPVKALDQPDTEWIKASPSFYARGGGAFL